VPRSARPIAPEVRELSRRLLPEAEALGLEMAERVVADVPFYRDTRLVSREQVNGACVDNMHYVLSQLAGEHPSADAPRRTGQMRAQQGVPYAAVLQAFRVGGRFIWELLVDRAEPEARDVLLLAAADIWAVSDDLSSQVTEAYRATLADRARLDVQVRSAHVATLLDGDSAGAEQFWATADVLNLQRAG